MMLNTTVQMGSQVVLPGQGFRHVIRFLPPILFLLLIPRRRQEIFEQYPLVGLELHRQNLSAIYCVRVDPPIYVQNYRCTEVLQTALQPVGQMVVGYSGKEQKRQRHLLVGL